MKKLSKREALIFIITLGLAVFFTVYQFVIKPMHEGAMDIDDQLRVAKDRLVKTRQMAAQKPRVEAQYQHLLDLVGVADSEDVQMPTVISKIEAAARDSNIHIANIQPQRSIIQPAAKFLVVELEIDGQWVDIAQFLQSLQQPPNFYFIDDLNLEKYSGETDSLRGRIVISRMFLVNP
jgi:Tfp pilus assembly protein PilO